MKLYLFKILILVGLMALSSWITAYFVVKNQDEPSEIEALQRARSEINALQDSLNSLIQQSERRERRWMSIRLQYESKLDSLDSLPETIKYIYNERYKEIDRHIDTLGVDELIRLHAKQLSKADTAR